VAIDSPEVETGWEQRAREAEIADGERLSGYDLFSVFAQEALP
jgi:hypothetical protein